KAWLMEYFMPHAFIELSPALIGGGKSIEGAQRIFALTQLDWDYPFYLSSPKRYVWSLARGGKVKGIPHWFQIPNQQDGDGDPFVPLKGLVRYFMSTDGNDLNTDSSLVVAPPSDPSSFQPF